MACANELYQCLTLGNASIFSLCVVNVWTRKMACVPSSGVQSPPKSLPSYVARGAVPEGTATQGADADFFSLDYWYKSCRKKSERRSGPRLIKIDEMFDKIYFY